ncbi:MAG: signal peptidase I [Candidatus Hydrogenedentales bacterium]
MARAEGSPGSSARDEVAAGQKFGSVRSRNRVRRWMWDAVKVLLIVLLLKWLVVDLVRIPSASMEPLLHGDPSRFRGDYVAVNKFAFGPRIPFTTRRIVPWGDVRRWDIVVFRNPDVDATHPLLIKRVVGLPGEEVLIQEGRIVVNGTPVEPPAGLADILYYMRFPAPSHEATRDMLLALAQRQTLPYVFDPRHADFRFLLEDIKKLYPRVQNLDLSDVSDEKREELIADVRPTSLNFIADWLSLQYQVKSEFEYGVHAQPQFMQIPPGHHYLLGDNSRDSVDSRAFGWVPREALHGRAFAIVLPPGRARDLSGFSKTWWGQSLLWGVPLSIVVYELLRTFVVTAHRVRDASYSVPLKPNDRVLVFRAAYGLRAPFTRRIRWTYRLPRSGDLAAYFGADGDWEIGPVTNAGCDPPQNIGFRPPRNTTRGAQFVTIRGDSSFERVPLSHVEGRVVALVWPWRRRRSFLTAGETRGVPD